MFWILFAAGAIIAYLATGVTIRIALRRGMLDLPNARSSHSVPVPRMGGLGILASFYLCLGILGGLGYAHYAPVNPMERDAAIIVIAGAAMAAIGLVDDLFHLRAGTKYLMQFAVAGLVFVFGLHLDKIALPFSGPFDLPLAVSFPLTILWLTGFSNVYNFMDGINGLAAGTGAIYGLFFFIFTLLQGSRELAAIAVLVSGSCLGFMFHNFPRARTFMGDSGSLFLGLIFSLLVVRLAQRSSQPGILVALLLVCSVYLFDSSYTIVRRLRRGENIFQAHRNHLYQRLVQQNLSHAKITVLYLVLHTWMGCLAVLYSLTSEKIHLGILVLAVLIFVTFALIVHRIEKRASGSKSWAPRDPTPSPNSHDLQDF